MSLQRLVSRGSECCWMGFLRSGSAPTYVIVLVNSKGTSGIRRLGQSEGGRGLNLFAVLFIAHETGTGGESVGMDYIRQYH